jgi:DNA polymerase
MLESWGALEPDVLRVERAINDRGVYLDTELCRALLACDELQAEQALDVAARALGWTPSRVREVAMSPQQFCEITGACDATKDTIDTILAGCFGASQAALILAQARRSIASIARGKLEAGLARVSPDSRLRDTHRYYGGHTGRWSGKGMQLQNLPRPPKFYLEWSEVEVEKWTDDDLCRLADAVKAGEHCATPDGINILLRAAICAAPGRVLAVCDFAGIEARALAWAARDEGYLDVFRSGRDPYKVEERSPSWLAAIKWELISSTETMGIS